MTRRRVRERGGRAGARRARPVLAGAVATVGAATLLLTGAAVPGGAEGRLDPASRSTELRSAAGEVPAPPAPDAGALARLPDAPSAVPGAAPVGACPAGIAPSGLDALTTAAPDAPLPAPPPGAGAGVTVAVVDTGVARHPRLAGRLRDGGDYVTGRSALTDCDGHGTAVAGVLAAAPSDADLVEGALPAATVLSVRQTSTWVRPPDRAAAGDLDTLARAVRRAASAPGVAVMTLALAACAPPGALAAPAAQEPLGALRAAVRDATDAGVVVVAAAGNVGPGCGPQNDTADGAGIVTVPVPGWFDDDVLTVGAAGDGTGTGEPDTSSLAGPWVDVAAPGRVAAGLDARGPGLTVALTTPGSGASPLAGTSFAAARVAGVAAELRRRDPGLSARAVAARIAATATPLTGQRRGERDPRVGAGLLDASAALGEDPAPVAAADGSSAAPGAGRGPAAGATGPVVAGVVGGVVALLVVLALALPAVRRRRSS